MITSARAGDPNSATNTTASIIASRSVDLASIDKLPRFGAKNWIGLRNDGASGSPTCVKKLTLRMRPNVSSWHSASNEQYAHDVRNLGTSGPAADAQSTRMTHLRH